MHNGEIMPLRKLTLLEIDAILQSAEAKQLHAELHIPDPGNILLKKDQVQLTLGHLSDERNGLHVKESRYSALEAKEFYPTSPEAGTSTTAVLNLVNLTAGAPQVDAQPAAGRVHGIQFIYAAGNGPFAANRRLTVYIMSPVGPVLLPIYESGAGVLTGLEVGLIFPTDDFTPVATYPGSRNSFDIWNTAYLRFMATGLAAAEEIDIWTSWKVKDAGGLRQ